MSLLFARFSTFPAKDKEGTLEKLVAAYTGKGGPVDFLSGADGFETFIVSVDKEGNCLRNTVVFSNPDKLAAATTAPEFESAKLQMKKHLGGPPAIRDGVVHVICPGNSSTCSAPEEDCKKRKREDKATVAPYSPALSLIPAISHVQLYSLDFDVTIAFWEAIGYTKVMDVHYGAGQRWTTLGRPGDGVRFSLTKGNGTGEVGHVLCVPDIGASFDFMKANGVAFKDDKIHEEEWGLYAVFTDPGGNTLCLSQRK